VKCPFQQLRADCLGPKEEHPALAIFLQCIYLKTPAYIWPEVTRKTSNLVSVMPGFARELMPSAFTFHHPCQELPQEICMISFFVLN